VIELPIKLTSIPRSKLLVLVIVVLFFLAFLFSIYWLGFKKEFSLLGGPEEYVVVRQINAYEEPNEGTKVAYIIPGKYFQILEEKGQWLKIKMSRIENGAEGWIKTSETAYKLIEE